MIDGSAPVTTEVSTCLVDGGLALYAMSWHAEASRYPLILVHGGGEHIGRHAETAERLARAGFAVHGFDLPGHGRSPGVRGHIGHFRDYLTILGTFIKRVPKALGQKPVLVGHSLGGLIAACYAAEHQDTLACLVLTSPLFGLSVHVPLWKRVVAYALSPLWPSLTLDRPRFGQNALSHDPEVMARYMADPLVHPKASLRLYVEAQRTIRQLPLIVERLRLPVLVMQAGNDHVVSAEATRRIFQWIGAKDKVLKIYEGYYHEILHETEKDVVHQELLGWLRQRVPAIAASSLPPGQAEPPVAPPGAPRPPG